MSTVRNLDLSFGATTEVVFGPGLSLRAERYDMDNSTLTQANYEPIFAAVYTQPEIILPTWTWVPPPVPWKLTTSPPPDSWIVYYDRCDPYEPIQWPGSDVPEPASAILFSLGLMLCLLAAKISRRRNV